jgi:hypothetical protein
VRIEKGRVVGGRIVVDDEKLALAEGTVVTILVKEPEDEESVVLTVEQEQELIESIAEADRGELVPIEEVFADVD